MTHEAPTLERYYRGWDRYQTLLTETTSPLTAELLAARAAPALRSVWELAAHIIAARVYWFQRVLGEGGPEITPLQAWDDPGMPERTAEELVQGLNATWDVIEARLGRWSPRMLDDTFTTLRGFRTTRQWVIWHVLEHDIHHGGELFLTLGMHGAPVPDL